MLQPDAPGSAAELPPEQLFCSKGAHEKSPTSAYADGRCKQCAVERGRRYRAANREKIRVRDAKYHAANREAISTQNARRYVENSQAIKAWQAANYQANREAILERNARYQEANRDAISAQQAEYRERLRRQALDHYGHRCVCCSLDTSDVFLVIDHVNGGGADHRRKLRINGGASFCKWLRDNGYPPDFQVLCWSCNGAKRLRPTCPHQEPVIPRTANQRYRRKLKIEVIKAYGGRCACCSEDGVDFLHLDHVNGGGKKHRQSLVGNPSEFYSKLRMLGFPNEPPLRVLCGNCNHAVRFGVCPHQAAA